MCNSTYLCFVLHILYASLSRACTCATIVSDRVRTAGSLSNTGPPPHTPRLPACFCCALKVHKTLKCCRKWEARTRGRATEASPRHPCPVSDQSTLPSNSLACMPFKKRCTVESH
ncbi:unnamed protein product [Ixodes pacificus]